MKREGKTLTNHSTLPDLGSALWTLRNFARDFKKDQKGLIKGEDLTLIEQPTQLTHTPSYREKYPKIQLLSYIFVRSKTLWSRIALVSTEIVHRLWLVNTLTSTAPLGSPIVSTWALADICEQWEWNLTARFSRRLWDRNAWRTPKNVCVGG